MVETWAFVPIRMLFTLGIWEINVIRTFQTVGARMFGTLGFCFATLETLVMIIRI